MDDLAGKLNELLQNPAISSLLSQLGDSGMPAGGEDDGSPSEPSGQPANSEQASTSGSSDASPFSSFGLDPDLLQTIFKIAPLLSGLTQEDSNTQLLHALRPMLGPQRQKKLDESVKLMQLIRMLPLLKDQGIL